MSRASGIPATIVLALFLHPHSFAQSRVTGHSSGPTTGANSGSTSGSGGASRSSSASRSGTSRHGNHTYVVAPYPMFIGGAGGYGSGYGNGDGGYDPSIPSPDSSNGGGGDASSQPGPVVINQYFSAPGQQPAGQQQAMPAPDPQGPGQQLQPQIMPQSGPEDDAAPAEPRTFLIAYKDHSVYSALGYWVEDHTLHYLTTSNTHNQADLSLIDIDFTKKLNDDQNMPFNVTAGK